MLPGRQLQAPGSRAPAGKIQHPVNLESEIPVKETIAQQVTTPVRQPRNRTWGRKPWLAVGFGLLMFLTTGATAQEIKSGPEAAGEKPGLAIEAEEAPPAAVIPEKPIEILPGELLPEQSRLPTTTLEVGPLSGVMAPYGVAPEVGVPPVGRAHRLGIVRLMPSLGYNAIYRTNIYQSYSNKVSDLLNLFSPGLALQLPLARHALTLSYLGNYFLYSKNGQNNHLDHNLNAGLALKYPAGLEILTTVAYRNAVEEVTSTTVQQRPYQRLTPSLQVSRRLADKWLLQGNYQFDMYQFAESIYSYDNRQDHNAGLTLLYKFWPKTAVLVQYLLQRRDYPDYPTGNSLSQTPFLGLTWDATAKLSGSAKFGYTFKAYDTAIPERDNNPGSLALSLQLLYRYSRYTQFSLVAQRSEQNDQDFGNAGYVNTAVYLSWQKNWHFFKVTSYLGGSYARNDYNTSLTNPVGGLQGRRLDNLYGIAAGLSRPLTRYLTLRFDYRYTNRGSNYPGASYMDHWVGLGLQSSF